MSKTVWRTRSAVGRMLSSTGVSSMRPRNSPPTIRTALLPRLAVGVRNRRGLDHGWRAHRCLEIGVGVAGELLAELVAQHATANLAHLAGDEIADLEGTVGDANEAVGVEIE